MYTRWHPVESIRICLNRKLEEYLHFSPLYSPSTKMKKQLVLYLQKGSARKDHHQRKVPWEGGKGPEQTLKRESSCKKGRRNKNERENKEKRRIELKSIDWWLCHDL